MSIFLNRTILLHNKTLKRTLITLLACLPLSACAAIQQGQLAKGIDIDVYYETSSGLAEMTKNGRFNYHKNDIVTFYFSPQKNIKIYRLNTTTLSPAQPNRHQIVFDPLGSHVLTNYVVEKKGDDGNMCFYDASQSDKKGYHGPVGKTVFQVTQHGIREYPSIGDHFKHCQLVPSDRTKTESFEPIEDFSHFKGGLLGCALNGCTLDDLNSYSLTAHDVNNGNKAKYRSVATYYNEKSKILIEKSKGIGKQDGIGHANLTEYLWITPLASSQAILDFNGLWRYTSMDKNTTHTSCILIKDGHVFTPKDALSHCLRSLESYTHDVSDHYRDMWWLKKKGSIATLADINAAVKYQNAQGKTRYTGWEYLPISQSLQQGTLYRYEYSPTPSSKQTGKRDVLSVTTFEKVK